MESEIAMNKSKKNAPIWKKKRPKSLKKSTPLSKNQIASAKVRAKKAGRKYPNLVDNMAVARKKT